MDPIDRRGALRKLVAGGVGAVAGSLWVEDLSALANAQAAHAHATIAAAAQTAAPFAPKVLSPHQLEAVAALSELIIPQTDTPGAKATLVDRFIDSVLVEAVTADRTSFLAGLTWLDARSRVLFGQDIVSATTAQQTDLLTRLAAADSTEERAGIEFFTAIKAMTITGYYTSEVGLRQELGDDGILAQATFVGCTHPEHQA